MTRLILMLFLGLAGGTCLIIGGLFPDDRSLMFCFGLLGVSMLGLLFHLLLEETR